MSIRGEVDNFKKLLATININYKKIGENKLAKIKKISRQIEQQTDL